MGVVQVATIWSCQLGNLMLGFIGARNQLKMGSLEQGTATRTRKRRLFEPAIKKHSCIRNNMPEVSKDHRQTDILQAGWKSYFGWFSECAAPKREYYGPIY
eukprot:3170680-Amphidinium_carterae.1